MVRKYTVAHPETRGIKKLALAGGVAMNIKVSSKILNSGLVNKLFVMPASSDTGSALGAAQLVWKKKYGNDPRFTLEHMYYGTEYTNEEILEVLKASDLKYAYCPDDALLNITAEKIAQGDALCWFQGKMEWGPRALGNRSILLNVKDAKANDKANRIKGRERWRSSAISILKSDFTSQINTHGVNKALFMIVGFDPKKKGSNVLLSGRHTADGSTRPQTVDKKHNPLFWRFLVRLKHKIGIGAVVNTSFNRQGEPIVESPQDAVRTFKKLSGVRYLCIGNYIAVKNNSDAQKLDAHLNSKLLQVAH